MNTDPLLLASHAVLMKLETAAKGTKATKTRQGVRAAGNWSFGMAGLLMD